MYQSAVLCHAGRRDLYQVAWSLSEAGLLEALVTDLYFDPPRLPVLDRLKTLSPKVSAYSCPGLKRSSVWTSWRGITRGLILKRWPSRAMQIAHDREIGRAARRLAAQRSSSLLSYSYYAAAAFAPGPDLPSRRILFQLHPHPASVRRLLQEEVERVPQASASLRSEHEVGSPEAHFQSLCEEPLLANGWIVASSFTAQTLVEHGIRPREIHVVPYGVDTERFPVRKTPPQCDKPLRLVWVGSLVQRKGLSYLLEALRSFSARDVELVICTHNPLDGDLLRHYNLPNVRVLVRLPTPAVVEELHRSHLFVLPSLIEGFGAAILEAMAAGLPVLTTPNSCGPDIVEEGRTGFIVPVRDSGSIIGRIEWALSNTEALFEMGQRAAQVARKLSWELFRANLSKAYLKSLC